MKMVKSLLLGSAAGLVAVTAGQAADLPVKAKPVEYVRICSLYGAGFYYMPGTDLCIKIGGWVRAEETYGDQNGSMTWGPFNGNANNRNTSRETFRARGYITADVRNQTEYGTVRGYIAVGLNTNDTGLQVGNLVDSANRAFVQWAGMTAGLSQSFFDFYSVPAAQYRGGYLPASDTGDGGWWVWAYTAQFGGGFSGTISTEARRTTQIIDQNASLPVPPAEQLPQAALLARALSPVRLPVAARCSRATALMVASRLLTLSPICASTRRGAVPRSWVLCMRSMPATTATGCSAPPARPSAGHPGDRWGWAAGVGIKINTPFITQGDWFQTQVNVTQGALRYLFNTPNTNWGKVEDGAVQSLRRAEGLRVRRQPLLRCDPTGCQLTSAWGFNASYEHYWTPAWHTSLYGA